MIPLALVIGAVLGVILVFVMYSQGMLAERSGASILLAAVALFYPVFAAAEGDWYSFALHAALCLAFSAVAVQGWKKGMFLIAGGLMAHGIFDIGIAFIGHPGPVWWPAFCAAVDIAVAAVLIRLLQLGRIST